MGFDIQLNHEKTDTSGGHRICYHSRWRSNTEFVLSAQNMTCNKITFKHTFIVLGVPSETFLIELPARCWIQNAISLLTSPIFMLVLFTSKIRYHPSLTNSIMLNILKLVVKYAQYII